MIANLLLVIMGSALMVPIPSFVCVTQVIKVFFARHKLMNSQHGHLNMEACVKILLTGINVTVDLALQVQTVNTTSMNVPAIHVELEQFVLMALIHTLVSVF